MISSLCAFYRVTRTGDGAGPGSSSRNRTFRFRASSPCRKRTPGPLALIRFSFPIWYYQFQSRVKLFLRPRFRAARLDSGIICLFLL